MGQCDVYEAPGPIDNTVFFPRSWTKEEKKPSDPIVETGQESKDANAETKEAQPSASQGFGLLSSVASVAGAVKNTIWRSNDVNENSENPEGAKIKEGEKIEEDSVKFELRPEDRLAFDPFGEDKNLFYLLSKQDWEGLIAMYVKKKQEE